MDNCGASENSPDTIKTVSRSPVSDDVFVSFDGGVKVDGKKQMPDRYRYWDDKNIDQIRISSGAGLSYAPASFLADGLTISHQNFNRLIEFDSETGEVEVEAGISLGELYNFLISKGYFLPIQPGHGAISVGGCIAAEVHGKNHVKDGTFSNQVQSLRLFHPVHGMLDLSRSENADLFELTCGGYGLTGNIISARLKCQRIPGQSLTLKTQEFTNLSDALSSLAAGARQADLCYSWHDMSLGPGVFGHSFVSTAHFDTSKTFENFDDPVEVPELDGKIRKKWRFSLINRWSSFAINQIYRRKMSKLNSGQSQMLGQTLFPIHDSQFYFYLFGVKGFHEYQALIPFEKIDEYMNFVQNFVKKDNIVVALASAKAFNQKQSFLRFSGEGICFTLNVPRDRKSLEFMSRLDDYVIDSGGLPNIIKDSRLSQNVVASCYPEYELFRQRLVAFDPRRLFRSELSERLEL